jgi:hypothetical protein
MDQTTKLNQYRRILQQVTEMHANMPAEPDDVESFAVCDTVNDQYLLLDAGWEGEERSHYVVFHLRLKDGKVVIEQDGIEYGIARDLIEAGIPEEDIVIAFSEKPPQPLKEQIAA